MMKMRGHMKICREQVPKEELNRKKGYVEAASRLPAMSESQSSALLCLHHFAVSQNCLRGLIVNLQGTPNGHPRFLSPLAENYHRSA
jgi:hypothetical protein